jgi:hypothetical protein
MRNITVFAGLVIIVLGTQIGGSQKVFAQNKQTYAFSVSPQYGFIYGQAEEIVYPWLDQL